MFLKVFKFIISFIIELLNFWFFDFFFDVVLSFGCEVYRVELWKDLRINKYYYNVIVNGIVVKEFCEYFSWEVFEYFIC